MLQQGGAKNGRIWAYCCHSNANKQAKLAGNDRVGCRGDALIPRPGTAAAGGLRPGSGCRSDMVTQE